MPDVREVWRDHSLTIVLATMGVALSAIAFFFDDKLFDLILGLGQGVLTSALLFLLSRYFREKAKPEDEPEP